MQELPAALEAFRAYPQFILYKLVPQTEFKTKKIPLDPHTLQAFKKGADWQNDPAAVTTFENASEMCGRLGHGHGVGFLFTNKDPFFFVDLDDCLNGDRWSDKALDIMAALSGAAIEVSQSGRGLHIFGTCGQLPAHAMEVEGVGGFYTEKRFVALTGDRAMGSAGTDHTSALTQRVIPTYYPPKTHHSAVAADWTDEPVPEWCGPADDETLIKKAKASKSLAATFGNGKSFQVLWDADEDALAELYPPSTQGETYNRSNADMALAQYLAFWTGKNCERIQELMLKSGLVRDKWDREDYLPGTILKSVSLQKEVYGTPKLSGSPKQIEFAESIRRSKFDECTGDIDLLLQQRKASWWIDHKDTHADELIKQLTPIIETPVLKLSTEPQFLAGYQFLGQEQQATYFKGCVYVQENHRVFVPSGALLKSEQFNASYGGFTFQLDDGNGKTTRKAFEALTESQCVRFPKAEAVCFRPKLDPGAIIEQDGMTLVNTYVPVDTPRVTGDAGPFLRHLEKILPDQRDQVILLSYMAACVQYKGVKFQWAPLIQGTFGNGKSLFSKCVVAAIGMKYSHLPPAKEIDEKFNSWLFNKIFIGVEDIYVPEQKRELIEVLKPMITGDWLAKRAMQQEQVMRDVCCNFIFNSNHKDAVRKTKDDRRFCVFFSAQQSRDDILRDGMGGDYFPALYDWLKDAGGYAVVNELLHTYPIPDEYNPAGKCHRAPETSTTWEAIAHGLGSVEQEILEAVDEGRPGFRGGWVSSMALDILLKLKRKDGAIPINKRREMLIDLGYDWHPALNSGRVNNPVMPDNGKPRLFIKTGNEAILLKTSAEVAKAYEEAQKPDGL